MPARVGLGLPGPPGPRGVAGAAGAAGATGATGAAGAQKFVRQATNLKPVLSTPTDVLIDAVTFTDLDVRGQRFVLDEAGTFSGVRFILTTRPTSAALDVGIYAADGTTRLGSSGAISIPSTATVPAFETMPFTANISLNANTEYLLAWYFDVTTGSLAYVGNNGGLSDALVYLNGAATVAAYRDNAIKARFANPGYAALPNGSTWVGTAAVAAATSPPFAFLVPA